MSSGRAKVALLTIDCVDEWLDGLHLQMQDFEHTQCGGWFNALHALMNAGYDVTLIGTSSKIDSITRFVNSPTGANVVMLPANKPYRWLKQQLAGRAQSSLLRKVISALVAYLSLPQPALSTLLRQCARDGLLVEQYGIARADMALLAASTLGIPVYGMYSSVIPESGSTAVKALRRSTLRRFDGLAVCSAREMARLRSIGGVAAERLHATLFPIDTTFWTAQDKALCRLSLGIPAHTRVAIWHGGFDVLVKGLDTLIAAWASMMQRHKSSDFRLLIIGNRHGSAVLHSMIAGSCADGINLLDRWVHDRSEIRNYLSAADCYVFPSRAEAFGIAPLEGMASGLPALLSETAGVAGLFSGEADGVIKLDPEQPDAWAAAIEKLLTDPALCDSLGVNARRAVAGKASIAIGAQALHRMLATPRAGAGN